MRASKSAAGRKPGDRSAYEKESAATPASASEVHYRYSDASGCLLYEVVRRPPKRFTQRRPAPGQAGGWIYNLDGVERVPYRLPELLQFVTELEQHPERIGAVFAVEGERDADRLHELGLVATTNAQGAKTVWPLKWADYFKGYEVAYVLPDNDEAGHRHAQQVASVLTMAVRDVRVVELPGLEPGGDVSDFLDVADLDRLWALCDAAPAWQPTRPEPNKSPPAVEYRFGPTGIVRISRGGGSKNETRLCNFRAEIVTDEEVDDGAEVRRYFEIKASLNGTSPPPFTLAADRFADVARWSTEHLGARAVVYPGQSIAAHVRVAIQELSSAIRKRRIFAHTGWRRIDGQWAYLHGGGAIGADGAVQGVEVRLPEELASYRLPAPPSGKVLQEAVRSSLTLIELAPAPTTVAVSGATYRSVLGPADFSLAVIGATGFGKSELVARAQQHFGADFNAKNFPGNWSSTANALGELSFILKDALQAIDDFAPEGSRADIDRAHAAAARVHRAQGNRAGRQRMHPDITMRTERPPRGLVISTGEQAPRGASVRARMLITELTVGALRFDLLTEAQRAGRQGDYAAAMAGFLRWLAPRYEKELAGALLETQTANMREELALSGKLHRRTPDAVASLALGWRYFLSFALEVGAISCEDHDAWWRLVIAALADLASAQSGHQAETDPVVQFLESLRSALISGDAHLTDSEGRCPDAPTRWGWRSEVKAGLGGLDVSAAGHQVGWVSGEHVYLDPGAALAVAAQLASRSGEPFALNSTMLGKRLNDAGVLVEREKDRRVLTVRKSLSGARRPVWSLKVEGLFPAHEKLPMLPNSSAEDVQ